MRYSLFAQTRRFASTALLNWSKLPISAKVGLSVGSAFVVNEALDFAGKGAGSLVRTLPGTKVAYSHGHSLLEQVYYRGNVVLAGREIAGENTTYRGMSRTQWDLGLAAKDDDQFHAVIHASHSEGTHQGVSTSYDPFVAKRFASCVATADAIITCVDITAAIRARTSHDIVADLQNNADVALSLNRRAVLESYLDAMQKIKLSIEGALGSPDSSGGMFEKDEAMKKVKIDINMLQNALAGLPIEPSAAHYREKEVTLTHAVPDHMVLGFRKQWFLVNYGPVTMNELYIDPVMIDRAGLTDKHLQVEKELCNFLQQHTVSMAGHENIVVPEQSIYQLQQHIETLYSNARRAGLPFDVSSVVDLYKDRYVKSVDQIQDRLATDHAKSVLAPAPK